MRGRFTVALALVLPLAAACGGGTPRLKTPEGAPPETAVPAVNTEGQQVGMSMGSIAGGNDLTGAAKDAYDRGFQAWIAGDLAGAKTAFNDAIGKAPKAAGPRDSLG